MIDRKMKLVVESILPIDENIRFVGIVSNENNTKYSQMNPNKFSYISSEGVERFAVTLNKIGALQDEFSDELGKTTFSLIVKEKIYQLVFFNDKFTTYVTVERSYSIFELIHLIEKVKVVIDESLHPIS